MNTSSSKLIATQVKSSIQFNHNLEKVGLAICLKYRYLGIGAHGLTTVDCGMLDLTLASSRFW